MDAQEPRGRPLWRTWAMGFALAPLLVWGLSAPFISSVIPYAWDGQIGDFVPPAGTTLQGRDEGWAQTRMGPHGVAALPSLDGIGPVVALWGDSYVEALQVADDEKIAQQMTAFRARQSGANGWLTAVGVGRSGRSVADYVHLIPRYERLLDVRAHVIVLGNIDDVLLGAGGFTGPPFALAETRAPANALGLRRVVHRFRLDFLWHAAQTVRGGLGLSEKGSLRFFPGPVAQTGVGQRKASKYDRVAAVPTREAVDFVLDAVQGAATRPVLFLYSPGLPRIVESQVAVRTADLDAGAVAAFERGCEARGIPFVNLGPRFLAYWRRTGLFPRGFHNGRPSRGHWNAAGHRLAAEAVVDALDSILGARGAVHPG